MLLVSLESFDEGGIDFIGVVAMKKVTVISTTLAAIISLAVSNLMSRVIFQGQSIFFSLSQSNLQRIILH